ncbi:hypothetical protein WKK05_40960 (plasmid) [Nostoc sp. UHCC 0302]
MAHQWHLNVSAMEIKNPVSQLISFIDNYRQNLRNYGTAMAWLWHANGNSMENRRNSTFCTITMILLFSQKIIEKSHAHYAKFGRKF